MGSGHQSHASVATVLMAEDAAGVRRVVARVLESAGYRVLLAEDGEDALRVAREHTGPIHVALLDVQMPKMTGPEAARSLAASRPETKILFMSAHAELDDLAAGQPVLQKPFAPDALLDLVRALVAAWS